MFSAKPTFFPRFAINDVTDGGGRVNVTEPPTDKKNAGWEYLEKPARDYMNWIHRGNYLWIDYFNQFWNSSHQFVTNEMTSESGNGIDILQPLGIKTVPISGTNLHVNQADSAASLLRFTNSTTGATATDGFEIGLDASEQGRIWNYENTDLVIGTNNTEMLLIDNAGNIGVRNGIPLYIYSAGNDKYLSLIHNDTDALISTNSGNIYTDKLFGIGVTPSNPLHVQSTTSPQVRIAYDTDSYVTIGVDSGGNTIFTSGEASGGIVFRAGASNNYLYLQYGMVAFFQSSDHSKLGSIGHNGTNLVIGTDGTTPGNIVISNTTEASAGVAALVSLGGIYSTKILWAHTDLFVEGQIKAYGAGAVTTNFAAGSFALDANTTGQSNVAVGYGALSDNTTGSQNVAIGHNALNANTTGVRNTAVGDIALNNNTTGINNTAIGESAGTDITTGSNLTCLGYNAEPSAANATNQVTFGDSNVTQLRAAVTTITAISDIRDKTNVQGLAIGLDFIMQLKPVKYQFDKREWYDKKERDGSKTAKEINTGLVAQDLIEIEDKLKCEWMEIVDRSNPDKYEVATAKILMPLVVAVQELAKKVEKLEKQSA